MKIGMNIMRKIALALIIIMCVVGCNSEEKQRHAQHNAYFEATKKAQDSPVNIKTTFLGFEFGMSQNQTLAHCKKLQNDGKLNIDAQNRYYYTFQAKIGETKVYLRPEFYFDSLYKIGFKFDDPIFTYKAESMFRESHKDFTLYILQLAKDLPSDYYRIKDNMIVHFDPTIGIMTYENAPILKRINQQNTDNSQKTLSDF